MHTDINNQCKRIGRLLPQCEVTLSENQDAFLLRSQELGIDSYMTVPVSELPEFEFQVVSSLAEKNIMDFLEVGDFNSAVFQIGNFFNVTRNYVSKLKESPTWIMEKVVEFTNKLPLDDIARGLGADSYSISVFPLGLSFNIPVKSNVSMSRGIAIGREPDSQ